jgi:hypothetical protein
VAVTDPTPKLERAIALAREAGLEDAAAELERRAFAPYTTSSEFIGEVGLAIRRFLSREGARLPPEAMELLCECLRDVGQLWPKYLWLAWWWKIRRALARLRARTPGATP